MISDLKPMLNHYVLHWRTKNLNVFGDPKPPTEDQYGNVTNAPVRTKHKCIYNRFDGVLITPALAGATADAKAVVWLLNHPNPINIGDWFTVPGGGVLKAIAIDERYDGTETVHRVSLS